MRTPLGSVSETGEGRTTSLIGPRWGGGGGATCSPIGTWEEGGSDRFSEWCPWGGGEEATPPLGARGGEGSLTTPPICTCGGGGGSDPPSIGIGGEEGRGVNPPPGRLSWAGGRAGGRPLFLRPSWSAL